MTRQDLIELATVNTERRYEKIGDMQTVFAIVLQDMCGRNRFWWRQFYTTFSTVQGTPTYDLTTIAAVPVLTEIAIEEVTDLALIQVGQNPPVAHLAPVFDPQTIIEMRQGLNINGTTSQVAPSRFTMDFNDYKTLRIDSPDGVYSLALTGWAMPNPNTDSSNNLIPLVPPWHHKALAFGMEAYIWKNIYGPTNPKYTTAKNDYENAIMLAQARPRFSTNYAQTLTQSEDAIRST